MSANGFTVRTELGLDSEGTPHSVRLSLQYDWEPEPLVLGEILFPFSMSREEGATIQEYFDEFSGKMFDLLATRGYAPKETH